MTKLHIGAKLLTLQNISPAIFFDLTHHHKTDSTKSRNVAQTLFPPELCAETERIPALSISTIQYTVIPSSSPPPTATTARMPQGIVKPRASGKASSKASTSKTKKGARVAKPKNATTADRIQKKYAAGLVARTEKVLGERAGHLEMIGKGRSKGKDKGAGKGKDEVKTKGGSRKFG
ncbi:hypothetical protein BJ170DRAFT_679521 [Xylariales sp. AK1849]|nr:hypothetical protein BJ170DRAFT_679521 [Xylariales sp. AK1849]